MVAPSYRAPLLWILLPMLVGYSLGKSIPNCSPIGVVTISLLLIVGSLCVFRLRESLVSQLLWSVLFALGTITLSLLYFQYKNSTPKLWDELPAREANLTIEVSRIFSSSRPDTHMGIGTVIETDSHLSELVGHSIYFKAYHDSWLVERGSEIQLRGVLQYLPAKKDELLFDKYLREQGIELTLSRADLLSIPQFTSIKTAAVARLKNKAIRSLETGIENHPDELGIYKAMLLGLKGELPADNKQTFLQTGTLHLFAISGLHVGIVALVIASILLLLRIPSAAAMVIGLFLVYIYVEVTGASPSAIRAFSMTAFYWAGKTIYRQMPPFQSLVGSAVTILILFPNQLFSAGFQLSYTVVTGILLWGVPNYQYIRNRLHSLIPEKPLFWPTHLRIGMSITEAIISSFFISLTAFISSLPLSIQYFEVFAPPAIFLNMLLVPVAALVITSGFLSVIATLLYLPWLSDFLNHGPLLLIHLMNYVLETCIQIPGTFYIIQWKLPWFGYTTSIAFLTSIFWVQGNKLNLSLRMLIPTSVVTCMLLINLFV